MPDIRAAVELLQAAADKLRALATAATPGPWRSHDTHLGQYGHTATVLSGHGNATELRAWLPTMSYESWDEKRNVWADAAYIAAMGPVVGLAVADWLEREARQERYTLAEFGHRSASNEAKAVALQILGEEAQQ